MATRKERTSGVADSAALTCDVLVVGGGMAGLRAAWAAYREGADVILCVKGTAGGLGIRGSGASSCGSSEFGAPRLPGMPHVTNYNLEELRRRILGAGLGCADPELVDTLLSDSPKEMNLIHQLGINTDPWGPTGMGFPYVQAFLTLLRKTNARIIPNTMVLDLLKGTDGEISGALAIAADGELVRFHCPSVVLASGGMAQAYWYNLHPSDCTGDGYAMALRAGAKLVNMEFSQIFLATTYPTANLFHPRSPCIAEIRNAAAEKFLSKYIPRGATIHDCIDQHLRHHPFSTRDSLSRYLYIGIQNEIICGREDAFGGMTLDLRGKKHGQRDKAIEFFRYRGIDLERDLLHLTVAHQCCNGGVWIDSDASAGIPGLYVAGENASGMHGADRIGGMMQAAALIFGARAGRSAARRAARHSIRQKQNAFNTASLWIDRLHHHGRGNWCELMKELKTINWKDLMLRKNESSLNNVLGTIDAIRKDLPKVRSQPSPLEYMRTAELWNLLDATEVVARSALLREESLGSHFRDDVPEQKSESSITIAFQPQDGQISVSRRQIDPNWDPSSADLGEERWG